MSDELQRCIDEQRACMEAHDPESLDWYYRDGALQGAADWMAEEVFIRSGAEIPSYREFLHRKAQDGETCGFKTLWMPDFLFDFQQSVTDWNIFKGKSASFLDCGMGKSICELVWSENVVRHTNKPVLIQTPLSVAKQMVEEGEKFGIEVHRISGGVPPRTGIYVTNYEKLHLFDPRDWVACVCDESSMIKAMNGHRRAQVTEFLRTLPYRLMATATAAPNDYIELGTTCEALGVMGRIDMLNRFFKNDQNNSDTRTLRRRSPAMGGPISTGWRFKGHAEEPFWRFICSFARAGRKPSDLGAFSDEKFVLPPLIEREHIVQTRIMADGMLFALPATNRQEELEERRRTIRERCEKAAELTSHTGQPYVIWCQLNPEGDLLEELCSDAVQISGSDSDEDKEEKYAAFLSGQSRGLVSKQKIGGWGMNMQHCAHVVEFASHSWESHYQGVRRCYRFGQKKPVINDIISTEGQKGAMDSMQRKSGQMSRMFDSLTANMKNELRVSNRDQMKDAVEAPSWLR